MPGYTPEEIAAFRAKVAGNQPGLLPKGVSNFDKKASDVSASVSRLATNPYVAGVLASGAGSNPTAPLVRDAEGALDLAKDGSGGVRNLSKATQAALDKPTAPEELKPIYQADTTATPVPSLKEQLLSKLQGGGGGGAGGGGNGLYSAFMAARRNQLGDFETDKNLAGQLGGDKAARMAAEADLQRANAAQMQRDAEIDAQAADKAHQGFQQMMSRNMELADDIGKQQIDPKRLVNNMSTGQKIDHILGSALGGFVSGFRGGPNETLERFDKNVAQDIQAQLNEQDNKKASLGARQSILGQMISETGDRRLAVLQARNLYYEAAKQKLLADAQELGIPEVMTQAQQTAQAFQHQQDAMNSQFTGEAWQRQQQQQAAAAAAQKAAERESWQRQMDLIKLGQEQDKITNERLKAGKESGKEDAAAIAEATKRLADDDVVKNRDLVNSLARKIDPKTGDIVGMDMGARIRGGALPFGLGQKILQSDEERIANQEYEQAKLLFQTKVTGTGGSDKQMEQIQSAFQGANTMAEKRRAIQMLKSELDRREGLAQAALDDDQKTLLQKRLAREGQTDMPKGVVVKQGNISDERAKQFKRKLRGY